MNRVAFRKWGAVGLTGLQAWGAGYVDIAVAGAVALQTIQTLGSQIK